MRHELRLRRGSDIDRVRASGRSWAHPLLVWVMRQRGDQHPSRFTVVVGKRVGNAVVRNRVRRRVREAVRQLAESIEPGCDVVLIARPPAATASYASLAEATGGLASRAGKAVRINAVPSIAEESGATPETDGRNARA